MDRYAKEAGQYAEDQLPDAGPLAYLLGYLSEVGEARVNGESLSATGWEELSAWASITCTPVTPGELLALRRLSHAYVDQQFRSKDPQCQPPCLQQNKEKARDRMERRMDVNFALFKALELERKNK